MYTLASLEKLRQRLALAPSDSSEDGRLASVLGAASASMEGYAARRFLPYRATILHSVNRHNRQELLLKADLLSLESLVNGDGMEINLEDVQVLEGALRLLNGNIFVYQGSSEAAIAVTGIWGFHPDWETAWQDSDDAVQDSPLSDSAETMTVADADNFEVGQLLKLEEEFCFVLAVDTVGNTLSLERAALGTVVASHVNGTSIEIYQVPAQIESLCLAWAQYLYKEEDVLSTAMPSRLKEELLLMRRVAV